MNPPATGRHPISAVINTQDAAQPLEAYLDTVTFADEILIVDSRSNEEAQNTAVRFGVRILPPVRPA